VLENENVQPQEPNATFNNPGFENDEEKFWAFESDQWRRSINHNL
jgi:hypothetical protein